MFLECLEEKFIIFGIGITRVVNMIVGRVNPGRRKLQSILKLNVGIRIRIRIRSLELFVLKPLTTRLLIKANDSLKTGLP